MNTEILSTNQKDAIPRATQFLRQGGLVAFPTDTVYGVGASIDKPEAIKRIYQVKGRGSQKAIPVLLASAAAMSDVVHPLPPTIMRLAEWFWPGPLTIVVPKHPNLPGEISATPTVGVRIPDHPVALALLSAAGPLAVTSANRSGGPNSTTAASVRSYLGGKIDLILDGGETPGGMPSTVVELRGDEVIVLREGPVQMEQILISLEGKGS
jgi:L-threonylcarbamoyladenylate synthase